MKQLIAYLVIILAIMMVLVALAKNVIAKAAVMGGVKALTGLDLHIEQINVGLLENTVGIRGLTLQNPPGFSDNTMIDVPEVFVAYDLGAFLQHRVHLKEVRLELKEFTVVKNPQGQLNLNALKVVRESKAKSTQPKPSAPPGTAPNIQLDLLALKIGKVIYKDYTGGGSPNIQEFPVNLHERYEHLTNPQAFVALVVSRALMNTTLARLTNLDLNALQPLVKNELAHATKIATGAVDIVKGLPTDAAKQLQNTATQLTDGATNVAGNAKDVVKRTGESLKKVLPFGN